jgi:uncharacterized protein YecE (DUF72 family)
VTLDAAHDPGFAAASTRAAATHIEQAPVIQVRGGGTISLGTASWTDPTITKGQVFYPKGVTTPEARLRYFASRFPLVEVDSSYYALPKREVAQLWVERTPDAFTFNLKAYAPMTGQPTEVARLPDALREALPEVFAGKARVYPKDLPTELVDAIWAEFLDAVEPLAAAGKLGAIVLQYPRWVVPSPENLAWIADARRRLGDVAGAVEFRNPTWFGTTKRETARTLDFLRDHGLAFVMVDGPQGLASSVPPVTGVTSPNVAMLRLHGRNTATWEAKGVPTVERYRYLYDRHELAEWTPAIEQAASAASHVHVVLNNCYGNYGTTNALELASLLTDRR